MKDCLIWGFGKDYELIVNQIQYEIFKKNINILGIVCRSTDKYCIYYDNFKLISRNEINEYNFDYIIIANKLSFNTIKEEALSLNIPAEKIIHSEVFELPFFDFSKYIQLIENPLTIISDDCWGGYIYHSLHLRFSSPFINIRIEDDSYSKLISNLNFYLQQPLIMEQEGDIKKSLFPIGSLGQNEQKVYLNFVHSLTFEDAKIQWERRIKRINYDNIFIKWGLDVSKDATLTYLTIFDSITTKKILFYPDNESNNPLIHYTHQHEWTIKKASRIVFSYFRYKDFIRQPENYLKSINILNLLIDNKDFSRDSM